MQMLDGMCSLLDIMYESFQAGYLHLPYCIVQTYAERAFSYGAEINHSHAIFTSELWC